MPRIRHILFPYDFSAHGDRTVPYVRAMAERFDARITMLTVLPPGSGPAPTPLILGELRGLAVEPATDGGDPAFRIVEFAKTHDVDLIMMPTHGVGGFRTMLVGSVTAKVLHDADCPIWTAAHAEVQTASAAPRTILCALDEREAATSLAAWTRDFAASWGAHLQLLHVLGPVTDWASLDSERRLQEQVREETRDRLEARLAAAGLRLPFRVAVGGIVSTVVEEARQQRADVIVVGRGSIAEPFGRLRTHAFGIIQRSGYPVVSV